MLHSVARHRIQDDPCTRRLTGRMGGSSGGIYARGVIRRKAGRLTGCEPWVHPVILVENGIAAAAVGLIVGL